MLSAVESPSFSEAQSANSNASTFPVSVSHIYASKGGCTVLFSTCPHYYFCFRVQLHCSHYRNRRENFTVRKSASKLINLQACWSTIECWIILFVNWNNVSLEFSKCKEYPVSFQWIIKSCFLHLANVSCAKQSIFYNLLASVSLVSNVVHLLFTL